MNRKKVQKIVWLTIIYTMAQGFLLIASGRWWDDWCFYSVPAETAWSLSSQMGRPSLYFIMQFVEKMPEPIYRIMTFMMFWCCMVFLYDILKRWLNLSDEAIFWICAIYAIVPVNDMRITHGAFAYTTGVFFFMAGLYILSDLMQRQTIPLLYRIGNLLLFTLSFTLNSNLCFYAIALLMILMKKGFKGIFRFSDYIVCPIVFFLLKCKFFPTWGKYGGYNSVSMKKIIGSLKYLPIADLHMIRDVLSNCLEMGIENRTYIIFLFLCCFALIINTDAFKRRIDADFLYHIGMKESVKQLCEEVLLGVVALSAGIFPYIVVRYVPGGEHDIRTSGLYGRDAMLSGFGIALILYGSVCLILQEKIRVYCFTCIIICGVIYFNTWYLSFQQNWYEQTGFRYQLSQHEELKEASNILCLLESSGEIEIRNFHQLNGNAEMVFGDTKRFFMGSKEWCKELGNVEAMSRLTADREYHMFDHDNEHKQLDAVVYYGFDVDLLDVAKMKMYELTGSKRYYDWLRERSWMKVLLYGTTEYENALLKEGVVDVG